VTRASSPNSLVMNVYLLSKLVDEEFFLLLVTLQCVLFVEGACQRASLHSRFLFMLLSLKGRVFLGVCSL
jgi:hypothetical protein